MILSATNVENRCFRRNGGKNSGSGIREVLQNNADNNTYFEGLLEELKKHDVYKLPSTVLDL